MTTVIRAVGATFTNPDLPSVSLFIKDGLVAAYRPKNTANGLFDLSGNGHNLTPIGNPTIKENGFVGDKNNGYNTGLQETINLTYMAVYKIPPETVSIGGFIMGCFQKSPNMGSSIYSLAGSGTTQPITAQTHATASNANLSTAVNAPAGVYTFVAMVVNAATNEVSIYIPKGGLLAKQSPTSDTIASRTLGGNNTVKLVAGTQSAEWLSKIELAEAAIYDKALTSEQIMQQYEKSKAYMQTKGIDI